MANEMKPLKLGDEVHIKSWNVYGKVIRVCSDTGAPEDQGIYQVQVTRYFRGTDLELYDREAERKKRKADLQEKMARLEAAEKKLNDFLRAGGDLQSAAAAPFAMEYMNAADAVQQALGYKPLLIPTVDSPK